MTSADNLVDIPPGIPLDGLYQRSGGISILAPTVDRLTHRNTSPVSPHTQVLKDLPERDPLEFVAMEAGGVGRGRWEEGVEGDGAGSMDEDEEEDEEEDEDEDEEASSGRGRRR